MYCITYVVFLVNLSGVAPCTVTDVKEAVELTNIQLSSVQFDRYNTLGTCACLCSPAVHCHAVYYSDKTKNCALLTYSDVDNGTGASAEVDIGGFISDEAGYLLGR